MSSSDCSECNNLSCEYRPDDHYNCYRKRLETLNKVINKKDIAYLLELIERIDKQEEIDYSNTEIIDEIKSIIFTFNDALKFKEKNNVSKK